MGEVCPILEIVFIDINNLRLKQTKMEMSTQTYVLAKNVYRNRK